MYTCRCKKSFSWSKKVYAEEPIPQKEGRSTLEFVRYCPDGDLIDFGGDNMTDVEAEALKGQSLIEIGPRSKIELQKNNKSVVRQLVPSDI